MNRPLLPDEFRMKRNDLEWECQYWHFYVTQGLQNQIQNNTRKDQRTYQRKFCVAYKRFQQFKYDYAEYFI